MTGERGSPFRTHGCRVTEFMMHGMRCLTMENERMRITLLLDKGADIVEFRHKKSDIDFMWRTPMGIKNPLTLTPSRSDPDGNFLDCYEGGWQELFPNIGAPCENRGAKLGIHGEACLLPWECLVERDLADEVCVLLSCRMLRTPFLMEKRLSVKTGAAVLRMEERIVNESAVEMDFMWGHHPALGGPFIDGDVYIDVPAKKARTFPISFHSDFPSDTSFDWPRIKIGASATNTSILEGEQSVGDGNITKIIMGSRASETNVLDLSIMPAMAGKWAGICYAHELTEGWCAATNPSLGLGFGLTFDRNLYPNVWLWMVYNGFDHYPWFGRTRTLAMEPYSSVPDNLSGAIAAGTALKLGPGEEMSTTLCAVAYESTTRVKHIDAEGLVCFCN